VHCVRREHCKWAIDLGIPLLWVETTGDVALEMEVVADRTNPEAITLEPDPAKTSLKHRHLVL
jgi:hypothetical protein